MASVNEVRLIGNLGGDPDLRSTQGGQAVATLSVATNRAWQDDAGKKHEEVTWHRVVVWGKQARRIAEFCKKGDPVYVDGRLQTRSYEDKEGVMRWATEVVARVVLTLKPRSGNGPPHPAERERAPEDPPDDEPPPPGDDDFGF